MASDNDRTRYYEGYTGPDLEFSYSAEVSYEPNENGLDGGRVQHLVITDRVTVDFDNAPSMSDWDAFHIWLNDQPKSREVARYQNGELTLDPNYPNAAKMVGEIRDWFNEKNIDIWGYEFDRSPPLDLTHDFEDAGRER